MIPEMADTVGVSKSSVSRQTIEASEAETEGLLVAEALRITPKNRPMF
jgi:hypothetical protein